MKFVLFFVVALLLSCSSTKTVIPSGLQEQNNGEGGYDHAMINLELLNALPRHIGAGGCPCEILIDVEIFTARYDQADKRLFLIGKVADGQSNEGLPGLRIYHVSGNMSGGEWPDFNIQEVVEETGSDVHGNFAMSIKLEANTAIHFEYIGYRSTTLLLGQLIAK